MKPARRLSAVWKLWLLGLFSSAAFLWHEWWFSHLWVTHTHCLNPSNFSPHALGLWWSCQSAMEASVRALTWQMLSVCCVVEHMWCTREKCYYLTDGGFLSCASSMDTFHRLWWRSFDQHNQSIYVFMVWKVIETLSWNCFFSWGKWEHYLL